MQLKIIIYKDQNDSSRKIKLQYLLLLLLLLLLL